MVNSHGNVVIPIPGEIMAVDTKGRVVSAEGVYDYNFAKDQETINSEVQANIQNLQNQIDAAGEGGTINYSELINKPKINNIELEGNVTLEIPDSYTKTESDAKYLTKHQDISGKADKTDVYTKEEVEYLIGQGGNFDPNLYYTKADIDEKGYLTQHQNIDGKANVGDSYTKSQSDNKYALKTDLNNKVDNITLADYALKSEIPERVYVDSSIDSTSTNPVQNKVIYEELRTKQNNLVGGVNIKNLKDYNSENVYNLIGEGSISFKTINGKSILGAGDIEVVVPGDEAGDGEGGEPGGSGGGSGKGEMNVIEYVSFNGNIVPIENKTAMITASIPTQLSQLEQNNNYTTVSQVERNTWNNKSNFSGSYNDLTNKPTFKTINGENITGVGNIEISSSSSPSDDSNLVHKTGDETINGRKTFSEIISVGLEHTSAQARSYNSIWTTNGSDRDLSDILRVYYYDGEELKTDQYGVTVNYTRLLTDPEIYNTVIVDENNNVYYVDYVDPDLLQIKFKNVNVENNLVTKIIIITKDENTTEGYTITRTEINKEPSTFSGVTDINYLTITSLEDDNTIYFSSWVDDSSKLKSIEYSIDNGKNWSTVKARVRKGIDYSYTDEYGEYHYQIIDRTTDPQEICTLNTNQKLLLRGNNSDYENHSFSSSKKFKVSGNIMSLCYSDSFNSQNSLISKNTFNGLFKGCVYLTDAGDLTLPSNVLSESCYSYMFQNCSSLTKAPRLVAQVLSKSCYSGMFTGCLSLEQSPELPALELTDHCYQSMFKRTKLQTAPILPATKLAYACYAFMFAETPLTKMPSLPQNPEDSSYWGMFEDCIYLNIGENENISIYGRASACCWEMFKGCASLTKTPKLPSGIVGEKAYMSMFEGCKSLTKAPELPATRLYPETGNTFGFNYAYMFKDCTNLTAAPELPAEEITAGCYLGMFQNCINLVTGPSILPATVFADRYSHTQELKWCYSNMFKNCAKLEKAPELPALILTQDCYEKMFFGCNSLNYIKCSATDISATDCTVDWVAGASITINQDAVSSFSSQEEFEEVLEGLPYEYGTSVQYIYTLTQTNASPGVEIGGGFNPYDMRTWPEEYKSSSFNPDYNYNYHGFVLPGWYAYYKNNDTIYTHMPELNSDNEYNYLWVSKREYNNNISIIGEDGEVIRTGGWGEYQTPVLLKYLSSENIGVASTGTFVKGKTNDWSIGVNGIPTNWTIEENYSQNYLTFDILTGGTINWNCNGLNYNKEISYSTNDGETWTTINSTTPINVVANDKLLVKGDNTSYWSDTTTNCKFSTSNEATFNLSGNIMSLVHGDNFIGKDTLDDGQVDSNGNHGWPNIFRGLFSGCSGLKNAENLILPITLSVGCFREMFSGSGITIAPKLLALKMANSCYSRMFNNCQSLTTAPDLPSTELATDCYSYMFGNCSSLTTAPQLPATKLYNYCYQGMFQGTAITESPELPATVLVPNCYSYMFDSCTNLNKITCNAYSIPEQSCTESWVSDVASTGTFITSYESYWTRDSIDGIPEGWTITSPDSGGANAKPSGRIWDNEEPYSTNSVYSNKNYLTMEILTKGAILWKTDFTERARPILYSLDSAKTWQTLIPTLDGEPIFVNEGDKVLLKGDANSYDLGYQYNYFDSTAQFNLCGNINSLINAGEHIGDTLATKVYKYYAYKGLFKNCKLLISAEKLYLPSLLVNGCFEEMFYGCINLTTPPYLSAGSTTDNCYSSMFENCISLSSSPLLRATTLSTNCYNRMFYGCSSLNNIRCYATNLGTNNTTDWVMGVATTGIFTKYPATVWPTGNSGIPTGWTVQ